MESKDTKKLDQNTTEEYMVTYLLLKNKHTPPERFTEFVKGEDLKKWFNDLNNDPSVVKCIVEHSQYLW